MYTITDGFVIPPTRWLVSIVTPFAVAAWGIRKKSLVISGAVLGKYSILRPFLWMFTTEISKCAC